MPTTRRPYFGERQDNALNPAALLTRHPQRRRRMRLHVDIRSLPRARATQHTARRLRALRQGVRPTRVSLHLGSTPPEAPRSADPLNQVADQRVVHADAPSILTRYPRRSDCGAFAIVAFGQTSIRYADATEAPALLAAHAAASRTEGSSRFPPTEPNAFCDASSGCTRPSNSCAVRYATPKCWRITRRTARTIRPRRGTNGFPSAGVRSREECGRCFRYALVSTASRPQSGIRTLGGHLDS